LVQLLQAYCYQLALLFLQQVLGQMMVSAVALLAYHQPQKVQVQQQVLMVLLLALLQLLVLLAVLQVLLVHHPLLLALQLLVLLQAQQV
jgi:hypothetical protein